MRIPLLNRCEEFSILTRVLERTADVQEKNDDNGISYFYFDMFYLLLPSEVGRSRSWPAMWRDNAELPVGQLFLDFVLFSADNAC